MKAGVLAAFLGWLFVYTAGQASGFPSFQDLVDAAEKDSILVPEPGTYAGPVILDYPLTIDGKGKVTIDGGGEGSVIYLDTDGAVIKNLHLTNSGSSHNDIDAGVQVRGKFNVINPLVLTQLTSVLHYSIGDITLVVVFVDAVKLFGLVTVTVFSKTPWLSSFTLYDSIFFVPPDRVPIVTAGGASQEQFAVCQAPDFDLSEFRDELAVRLRILFEVLQVLVDESGDVPLSLELHLFVHEGVIEIAKHCAGNGGGLAFVCVQTHMGSVESGLFRVDLCALRGSPLSEARVRTEGEARDEKHGQQRSGS